ncbi:MAG: integrase core domain-containing protein, partial [Candidatus Baltobacteraceae bacterium]
TTLTNPWRSKSTHRLTGERVTRVLNMLAEIRGLPKTLVMDNGTELTSLVMLRWAADRRVRLHHIAPGKPTQNAFIESFNCGRRDKLNPLPPG